MYEDIIKITGKAPGPVSIILAGVHGDETCGVAALSYLLPVLTVERGTVLIGLGNPRAVLAGQRFMETNLNRLFCDDSQLSAREINTYEYERAQYLKKYLNQTSALLDIHASNTPGSQPFIICESGAKGIIEYLPMNLVVSGFDAVQPGGSDYFMNRQGKIGICVECGYIGDPLSMVTAKKSIIAFLQARGHNAGSIQPNRQSYLQINFLYKTKTANFVLAKSFADFECVAVGQLIGFDGEEKIFCNQAGVILFARSRSSVGAEAFLLGEKKDGLC